MKNLVLVSALATAGVAVFKPRLLGLSMGAALALAVGLAVVGSFIPDTSSTG